MRRFTQRVGWVVAAAIWAGGSLVYAQLALQPGQMQVSGTIEAVSPQEHTLKLHVEPVAKQPAVFLVDAQTNISDHGRAVQFHELAVGERVTILYVAKDGKQLAQIIYVATPEAAQSPSARSPATSAGGSQ